MPVTLWILPRPPRRELNSGDCCGCDAEERTSDLSRQPSALVHQLSDIRIHPLDLILQGRGPNAEVRGLHFQSSRRYELPLAAAKRRIWHGGCRFGRRSVSHRAAHSSYFLVSLSARGRAYAYGVACDYASSVYAELRGTVAEIAVFGHRS